MKRIFISMVAALLSLSLCGQALCAQQTTHEPGKKNLIIYYSLSGNTRTVAAILHELVGGDSMEIQTVRPYPDDFHAVVEQAREERRTNFLPPIQSCDFNPQNYDTIYLGFPIWGNTIPQPMATFLSQNNLAGKTIIPFCTHDGYGVGRAFQVVSNYCPNARVLDGFDMLGSDARNAQELLSNWLNKLGILTYSRTDTVSDSMETPITVTIGDMQLTGFLNADHTAQEFKKRLPVTISMIQYGGREYYGSINEEITTHSEGRLSFDDGDITYCPQNNTIAIFYSQANRPNLTMNVIPIGKVTSDLSGFHKTERYINVTFNIKN